MDKTGIIIVAAFFASLTVAAQFEPVRNAIAFLLWT